MFAVLSRTWTLYAAMALLMAGLGFQNTILPIIGNGAGTSATTMGYVMSMYYLGYFIGVYLVPKLIRRVGFTRVFATLATLIGSIIMLYGVTASPITWLIIRVLTGFCFSGLSLVTETWINDAVDNKNRGKALSMYLVVSFIGLTMGQYVVIFSPTGGLLTFMIMSLVLSLSFVPVLLSVNAEPKIQKSEPMPVKVLYKASPMGAVGILFVGVGNALSFAIGGVYIVSVGGETGDVSTFLVAGSVGTIIGLYPAGKISDMIDRRFVIVGLCIISLIGVSLVYMQDNIGWLMFTGFALVNVGLGPLYSVCIAQTNDWIEDDERMSAAARLGFLYGVGSLGGSIVVSTLLSIVGSEVFIYSQVCVFGGLLIFAVSRIYVREAQVEEEQANFIPYPVRPTNIAMDVYDDEVFEETNKDSNSE